MSQASILVTGGAGYIGSHICRALSRRGYNPVTLDNLSRGHRDAVKFGPLVEGDIGDAALVRDLCERYQPLAALHFAALIEVGESVLQPALYRDNNAGKVAVLAEALQSAGVDKFVLSSTAAVYGIPASMDPITEDAALAPINPYGASKLEAENFLRRQEKMRCVALRYFNAAGANDAAGLGEAHIPETHLIPNALLATLGIAPPLTVFGDDYPTADGTAIRDYIHVEDLADAHLAALDYLLQGGDSTAVNLGSGSGFSIRQILASIEANTGKTVPFSYGLRRAGDPPFLVADNQKASRLLGWRPTRDLDAIIGSAWRWHGSATYLKLTGRA